MSKNIIRQSDVIAEKNRYGYWVCSAIVDGVLRHGQYINFTKRHAIRYFTEMMNSEFN